MNHPKFSKDLDQLSTLYSVKCFILIISIFITAINVQPTLCVIPEASQEGPLHSFDSYEDITIFHYNVPKEVLRATWQFAAFSDNGACPQREVNIFLRWGSFPVVNGNNATYPPHMFIDNNETIQISAVTTFEPKTNIIVPVYSPKPGDWFVGAYLSHWDQDIYKERFGLKCHYSLGSVAIWSEITGIQNIPLGYQKTIMTSETISYYKIFIPRDTWNFQVDVWGCNYTFKKDQFLQTPCIKHLNLKAKALPFYNHSSSIGKLTPIDTYTFSELYPYQDTWYYLIVVSNSAITFNVKVSIFDCPLRTMRDIYLKQYINKSVYTSLSKLYVTDLKNQSMQWNLLNENENQEDYFFEGKNISISQNNTFTMNSCIPRYKLVRIQNVEAFSRDYLIQGREWLTSWLTLTSRYPVITEFEILPLVDIGGTLNINISLELDKNYNTSEVVKVDFCISHGRVPKQSAGNIKCDNGKAMEISSTNQLTTTLLIPFPQPDTWYITFQTSCSVNGTQTHCEMEEIMVSVNIKLQACIYKGNNSCGEYGVCKEIEKGSLFYSTCKCFGGYQGWGCNDPTNAISELTALLATLALTLSNLFFIPATYLAYKRKLYTESLIYFSTMLFSTLYHACDEMADYCITKYQVLQYCDFFLSRLSFWVTSIAMADLSIQYISFFHMAGVVITVFALESDKTGLLSTLIPMIIGVFIPLYSYGHDCFKMKKLNRPRRFIKLIIGLSLAGLGMIIFALAETESNYKYVHSAWHAIIAISLIFVLPPEQMDAASSTTDKLFNDKESSDESVFNVERNIQYDHI